MAFLKLKFKQIDFFPQRIDNNTTFLKHLPEHGSKEFPYSIEVRTPGGLLSGLASIRVGVYPGWLLSGLASIKVGFYPGGLLIRVGFYLSTVDPEWIGYIR